MVYRDPGRLLVPTDGSYADCAAVLERVPVKKCIAMMKVAVLDGDSLQRKQ